MGIAFRLKPISCKSVLTYTTWQLQSDSTIYSASVDDNATVFYVCDVQLNIPSASLRKYPVTDL